MFKLALFTLYTRIASFNLKRICSEVFCKYLNVKNSFENMNKGESPRKNKLFLR